MPGSLIMKGLQDKELSKHPVNTGPEKMKEEFGATTI
jgi:hypothetical protein